MKIKKKVKMTALLFLAVVVAFSANWLLSSYKPTEDAVQVFNSNTKVEVSKDKYIAFAPRDKAPDTALIFYPGGKVSPEAYAPLCSKIAA
jgi:uncharacterized membrane protein